MPKLLPDRQPAPSAAAWFDREAGRVVLASEAPQLALASLERPGLPWVCVSPMARPAPPSGSGPGRLLWLHGDGGEVLGGDVDCADDAWPLVSESVGCVVLQHAGDSGLAWPRLLDEAQRVLVAGGRLWVFALNPLSPFRRHWWRQGLRDAEPFTWRRRLRQHGFTPDAVAEGIGPGWRLQPEVSLQTGAGGRAAYLLRAEKRAMPMTPLRAPMRIATQPALGTA